MKHTKIVCTIGPASQSRTVLERMVSAGMNVARLNFSHGTYADHTQLIKTIRTVAKKTGQPIAILQDLQGPRIRIGEVPADGVSIRSRETVVLMSQRDFAHYHGKQKALPMQHPELHRFVKAGSQITIADGVMDLLVQRVTGGHIVCRVRQGGLVKSHKGMNFPGVTLDVPVITKKDKQDLAFGIRQDIDFVSLSFVKDAKDIARLRRLLPASKRIKIVPKIERAEAVANFDEILAASDGIMLARGDLGVELGPAAVPLLQKEIIQKCLKAAKPIIVATQMLESMVNSPRPTRAEAADVANAVIDHADALMLSGESAAGKYPVKAVQTMASIARTVERSRYDDLPHDLFAHRKETQSIGVAHAAVHLAESINAACIAVLSHTGGTAALISQLRPQAADIVVFTNDEKVLRQLSLVWGVHGIKIGKPKDKAAFTRVARQQLRAHNLAKKGDYMVIVTGVKKKDLALAEAVEI
jgi:pyruvate kinase